MNRWAITQILWMIWQACMLGTPADRRDVGLTIGSIIPHLRQRAEAEIAARKQGVR